MPIVRSDEHKAKMSIAARVGTQQPVLGQYPCQRAVLTDSLAEYPTSVINATKNYQVR
jgi:hypothetical protein